MKDPTLDEMLEIAAEREAANEALFKQQQSNSKQDNDDPELDSQLRKG
jgi:hypothetical protein